MTQLDKSAAMALAPRDLLIDGHWRQGAAGRTFSVDDPATEERVADVACAEDGDIAEALTASERGFAKWRATSAWERSAILRAIATAMRDQVEAIATVMTIEQGKPLAESRAEVRAASDQFDWYADEARRIYGRTVDAHSTEQRITVKREPVGVVAAFSAWNFPILLPSRKVAPALAAGCSVIVKPAEEAPLSTLMMIRICVEAGVPDGAIQALMGDPRHISEALVLAPQLRKVSLTGSVPVGKTIMELASRGLKEVTLELGGHAPVLVFADADVARAAEACAAAKFRNGGQVCASPSRFFVQEAVADAFTDAFVRASNTLRVGSGLDPETDMGPLVNDRRMQAAEALVTDVVDKGGRVASGGSRPSAFERGYFFSPTVVTDISDDMALMREEPFSPVAPISVFDHLESVLARANSVDLGLASFVFTQSLRTAHLASEGLEAGMVGVNTLLIATAQAPFGGVKQSGFGREGGSEGILDYLTTKYVTTAID